jgi:hypothetical protein
MNTSDISFKYRGTTDRAKELFWQYSGSHYFMAREDEYEKYKSFGISTIQETEWARELVKEHIVKLIEAKAGEAIHRSIYQIFLVLGMYQLDQELGIVLDFIGEHINAIGRFDKLRICEECIQLVEERVYNQRKMQLLETADRLIIEVQKESHAPIEGYPERGGYMQVYSEDDMNKRIQIRLNNISKLKGEGSVEDNS